MKSFRPLQSCRTIAAVIIALMSTVFVACTISYKLNGAAIDYNVYKTIQVSQFPIRAALVYPPLQQTFENDLLIGRGGFIRRYLESCLIHPVFLVYPLDGPLVESKEWIVDYLVVH